jgi:diguanylate cyclase (GGDEF)-like protein
VPHDELEQLIARADRAATLDPLTGIATRAGALDELARLVQLCGRHRRPLSVLRLDVGPAPGGAAADHVLQAVARALATALRLPDLPARWGDATFVVLLPETALDGATAAADRLAGAARAAGATVSARVVERARDEDAAALTARIDAAGPSAAAPPA